MIEMGLLVLKVHSQLHKHSMELQLLCCQPSIHKARRCDKGFQHFYLSSEVSSLA